jgi:3-oxoacyl-[acyl-carrier protein] reductase
MARACPLPSAVQEMVTVAVERFGGLNILVNNASLRQLLPLDEMTLEACNAALEGMVRSLAHELAPYGVTANAISPGMIDTVRGASAGKVPASIAATGVVLGRKGKSEEIAAMVRALCGPAGRYVTGQTINANGGMYFN